MSTVTSSTPTSTNAIPAATAEVLAATIAAAVERQLTQYVSAMSHQVEAARQAAEQAKEELRAEFSGQLQAVLQRIDAQQHHAEAYQKALQTALEERLADFAQHQQRRIAEVEQHLLQMPTTTAGFDANELATLRDQIDSQSAAAHARIDDLQKSSRRFDEQASALVQHVNDTTVALTQRMDDGNRALATAVEERLALVRTTLEAIGPQVQRQVAEHTTMVTQRIDMVENKVTDRMLEMEDRVNETSGTKIAQLEATIGRVGSGFDDAMAALSQRLLGLENRLYEHDDRMTAIEAEVAKVDERALGEVKEQLSSAIGEAMLVRIELDRLAADVDEKIDKSTLRMAEIEAQLADTMDVSAAVQLERLEELERAIIDLDPDQFVRRTDPGQPGLGAPTPSQTAFPAY
ncbi:MAG: hypothetical protein RI900_3048 [Actinomycetota bacterium]|jgi:hypothetical protein